MGVKLLTEHHLEFLSLKAGLQTRLSLHLSNCHIVGNHMSQLISFWKEETEMMERIQKLTNLLPESKHITWILSLRELYSNVHIALPMLT